MRQVAIVEGTSLQEYTQSYNETLAELSRFTILKEEQVDSLTSLIYYETPDAVEQVCRAIEGEPEPDYRLEFEEDPGTKQTIRIELRISAPDRHCCECSNYDWGKGCQYKNGHIKLMDNACPMFNVTIEGRF